MLQRDVAPGIHRVEDAYTNWYLVEADGALTIVDAGVGSSWSSLVQAVNALARSPDDIQALILTHAHLEHIGAAERIRSELGVPVHVHENDVPLTKQPRLYSLPHDRARVVPLPGSRDGAHRARRAVDTGRGRDRRPGPPRAGRIAQFA